MILYPPSSQIAFYIFDYPIRIYGIIMSCAIFIGIILSTHFYKKYGNNSPDLDNFYNSFFWTIILSVIGARTFYVIGNIDFYSKNLSEIIKINHGGISIWGAIFFGVAGLYFYCKNKKTDLFQYLDFYSLVMPLCQAIGRWGNYFNQEAYGKPAFGFIKLFVNPEYRISGFENYSFFEPAFLYESILDLILFLILLFNFKKLQNEKGLVFLYYIFIYSIIRIIIESIRIDSVLNIGKIPVAILISLTALLISTIFIIKKTRQN